MDGTGDFAGILKAEGQTLQATALVHEVWLKLAAGGERTWADRAHFFRAAAQAMRQILVDRARGKGRLKRGEGRGTIDIQGLEIAGATPDEGLISLKFFGGLTEAEIASMEGMAGRNSRERGCLPPPPEFFGPGIRG